MFNSLKRGIKKLIPGQSGQSQQLPPARRQIRKPGSTTNTPLSSLPKSYLDEDSLFK